MIRVSREIRFSLSSASEFTGQKPVNSWAGGPATNALVPRLTLRSIVDGKIDPKTGYLCNIKLIDKLLRDSVAATLRQLGSNRFTSETFLNRVSKNCHQFWKHDSHVKALELDLSPFLTYRLIMGDPAMISLTEQFEFSAAHRLHCDDFSDEQNQEVFGKCNYPNGHGHNYVVAVTLSKTNVASDGQVMDLDTFESTVNRLVIDRLDHKNLNLDEPYFAEVNPTVENIAIAIYGWLNNQFGDAALEKVRVYETPKTWAEYPVTTN